MKLISNEFKANFNHVSIILVHNLIVKETITFENEGVVYKGEVNSKQEFYGEGNCKFKSGDIVQSTWRAGKEHGYSQGTFQVGQN